MNRAPTVPDLVPRPIESEPAKFLSGPLVLGSDPLGKSEPPPTAFEGGKRGNMTHNGGLEGPPRVFRPPPSDSTGHARLTRGRSGSLPPGQPSVLCSDRWVRTDHEGVLGVPRGLGTVRLRREPSRRSSVSGRHAGDRPRRPAVPAAGRVVEGAAGVAGARVDSVPGRGSRDEVSRP